MLRDQSENRQIIDFLRVRFFQPCQHISDQFLEKISFPFKLALLISLRKSLSKNSFSLLKFTYIFYQIFCVCVYVPKVVLAMKLFKVRQPIRSVLIKSSNVSKLSPTILSVSFRNSFFESVNTTLTF